MRLHHTLPLSLLTLGLLALAPAAHAQVTESFIGINLNGQSNGNQLFRFSASTTAGPSNASIPFTNLAGGAGLTTTITNMTGNLESIDFRPSNGLLYGLTNASGTLRLYTIDTTTGAASLVSQLVASTGGANPSATPFADSAYTIDFNPQADALRIVNAAGANYRISSTNLGNGSGTTFTDTALSQNNIRGIAYTNNVAGATSTRLFDTQSNGSTLFEQTPPNAGTLVAQSSSTGFSLFGDADVSGITDFGYFAGSNFGGLNAFYRFNDINTDATTTQVGTFSGLQFVTGLAAPIGSASAAPEPGTLALLALGGTLVILKRRRK
ncbi:DUF4394 domain-containing protein [Armatimonas sp.]|uniref:DUF4394 domain-containing protein n=1 Tax=Armatimonas sp. TaxID=1872638 RepID=UPI00286A0D1B|nr:DUF4394 domain-containing protein [Armatimonas sp.]